MRPNYSRIIQDINRRNIEKKNASLNAIRRRLRAASGDTKVMVASNMLIRISEGRVA